MTNVSDFRKHLASKSFSGSTFDSPLKEDPLSILCINKKREGLPEEKIHQQGQLRENLIREIQDKDLLPFGMLTIRPDKHLQHHQCQDLSFAIDKALENRYNPRYKHHWGSPHLIFYERDKSSGYETFHIHILFSMLPIDRVINKKTLTYPVKDAVEEVTGGQERLSPRQLHDPKFHAELIEYAIRNPWEWMNHMTHYSGYKHFPKGKSGLHWLYANDEGHFDGFYGWKGLVAYVTKQITDDQKMDKLIDRRSMSKLRGLPKINSHI